MGEVVPARTSLTLPPHPLALCCNYPVAKYCSASIVATSTLRVNKYKMVLCLCLSTMCHHYCLSTSIDLTGATASAPFIWVIMTHCLQDGGP